MAASLPAFYVAAAISRIGAVRLRYMRRQAGMVSGSARAGGGTDGDGIRGQDPS